MADLHNPLFEDEKEFLERQKLEYERALMGDVEEIKAKTQEVSKYVAIGAGVLGGVWLLSKIFGGKKKQDTLGTSQEYDRHRLGHATPSRRPLTSTAVDTAVADDLGFGAGHHQQDRGQTKSRTVHAPLPSESYAADNDPFAPVHAGATTLHFPVQAPQNTQPPSEASTIVASALKTFLQSDTGKMLVAQASAVLMAYVAKKASEYLPILKNTDLASSGSAHAEPETKDIEFTYHHDDADAPQQHL